MLVFDDEQHGLGVRVTSGGSKSYVVRAISRNTPGMVESGASRWGPAAERNKAAKEARLRAAHESFTLATLLSDWQSLHLASKRPRYAAEAVRVLRYAFSNFLDLPAADLSRANVVKVFDAMARQGSAAMAGRSGLWLAAEARRSRREPLCQPPRGSTARAIWRPTATPGPFNDIVRMLILTGQRREEVSAMTWAEPSADLSTWIIPAPRAKNNATHVVPLNGPAQGLLRNVPRLGELVFAGLRGPFNGFSKAKADLDAKSVVIGWQLHDLRRTMATGLQRLGVRLEATEQILNHGSGSRAGIVGVYQRHDFASEKRAALEAWGEHALAIVEGRGNGANVIALRAG